MLKLVNRYKQRKDSHYIIPWEANVIPDKPPNNFRPLEHDGTEIVSRVNEVRRIAR
jgi:hypothetical protein